MLMLPKISKINCSTLNLPDGPINSCFKLNEIKSDIAYRLYRQLSNTKYQNAQGFYVKAGLMVKLESKTPSFSKRKEKPSAQQGLLTLAMRIK